MRTLAASCQAISRARFAPPRRLLGGKLDRHNSRNGGRSKIVPKPVHLRRSRWTVVNNETIKRPINLSWRQGHLSGLLGGETEERLGGMHPHRLRSAEVVWMPQNGQSDAFAFHLAPHITPTGASGMRFLSIAFSFRSQKVGPHFSIPSPVPPDPQPSVMIFWQTQRLWRRAGLHRLEIERPIRARRTKHRHLPTFVQRGHRL